MAYRVLETLEDELVVVGADSHPQQVAQVLKHGHEGKLPAVCRRWAQARGAQKGRARGQSPGKRFKESSSK